MQRKESLQLGDRTLVVVDAQVDDGVEELRVAGVLLDDEECGRLLSAAVASGCLRRCEALEEPLGQLEVGIRLERRRAA